jgi:hypothetical protein
MVNGLKRPSDKQEGNGEECRYDEREFGCGRRRCPGGIWTMLLKLRFAMMMVVRHRRRRGFAIRTDDDRDCAMIECRHEPGRAQQPHREQQRKQHRGR